MKLGFLWDATREQVKKKPWQRFIDEVWPGSEVGMTRIDKQRLAH